MLQRLKEAEMFKEWEQQEDQACEFNIYAIFHFVCSIPVPLRAS